VDAQRHLIERPRLTTLLDGADARTILLIAPAGYGKTTLAREWTGQRGRTGLWYRARRGASDVAILARCLSQALAPLSPTIERSTRELLSALNTPEEEPEVVADLLVEELDDWPDESWLVIDEYELVAPHPAPVRVLERFVAGSGARVLLTGRERPDWVTPRDLLYGDAFELRASALSMTNDEASQVLEHAGHFSAGLVALADGWPAVIGLAALLPGEVNPTSDAPPALFDYVAQELFDELEPEVQKHLVLLSVPATLTPALVQAVLGDDAEVVLGDSTRVGFVTEREPSELEIHPLCRAFLERKMWDVGVSKEQIDKLALALIDGEQWDDAFEAIRAFDLDARLPLLIERALRRLLVEGRHNTIDLWITFADQHGLEVPEVALARAEMFLRRGNWEVSEVLASRSAKALTSPELVAEAHLCAGSSAQLLDEVDRAWDHFGSALDANVSPEARRRALWGRFITSYWTRRSGFRRALTELERHSDTSPDHILRLGQAQLVVAERDGAITAALATALAVEPLLTHVEDPFVRSGFLNNLAHALTLAARYAEAEDVAQRQIEEANRFRLTFAMPSALINLAAAQLGRGFLSATAITLARTQGQSAANDPVFRVKRDVLHACISLARGESGETVERLRAIDLDDARSDMAGEALAVLALAEACYGEAEVANDTLRTATDIGQDVGPKTLLAATRAILALGETSEVRTHHLNELARTVGETGCFDGVVCALRANAELLAASREHSSMIDVIRTAAQRSGDGTLSAAVGERRRTLQRPLTQRERDILSLVAEGFQNAEIGRRLFISPKTVKTHLQNIYKKLGVKSRTEAAVKAKEAGLLG
jgi:LuxR family maltose regulon positive regulatory protein